MRSKILSIEYNIIQHIDKYCSAFQTYIRKVHPASAIVSPAKLRCSCIHVKTALHHVDSEDGGDRTGFCSVLTIWIRCGNWRKR